MKSSCQYRAGLLVVGLGLSLAACHQSSPTADATAKSAADRSTDVASRQPSGGTIPTAKPAATGVQARGFATLMQALPADKQVRVSDWYKRMGGPPIDNGTPAQVAWMEARHYPMPADIARAASMSQAKLRSAADTGNTTAQILYTTRLLNEYNAYITADTPMTVARYRDPNFVRLGGEIDRMMRQILPSGSPYAGYLFAAKARLMNPSNDKLIASSQLAGLVWASKFGDARANRLLDAPTMQAVDAAAAATAINGMLTAAMYANPSLFSATIVPIPASHP
jgi:hypothetical protein